MPNGKSNTASKRGLCGFFRLAFIGAQKTGQSSVEEGIYENQELVLS
jgi:hypothetical protein